MDTKTVSKDWTLWVFDKAEKAIKTASTPLPVKEMAWKAVKYAVACGSSDPLSYALRPILYHKNLRKIAGMLLVTIAIVIGGLNPLPGRGADTGGVPMVVLPEGEAVLTTLETNSWPVTSRQISQNFWFFHGGIDIRTPEGSPIKPVMAGKVIEVEKGQYGYGEKIVINHRDEYKSLYAHLSKIFVKVGENVTTETLIGLSGNTGRSTGPHLHLEIHYNNKPINPMVLLSSR